ncbi:hypothetical protein PR048_025313 [Dryococelus australis]|uniref:Uncharacterized protein n=1 Tax=Dryococelus australis TaxID=614101 RepID=A0ABQ9GR30_9NEOP|nr:hypothetical protein PR048_025313 [Dryococelus australis]
MLRDWSIPQLQYRGLLAQIWFQQDGAPARYVVVRKYFNDAFRDKLIEIGTSVMATRAKMYCRDKLNIIVGHLTNAPFEMHLHRLLQQC